MPLTDPCNMVKEKRRGKRGGKKKQKNVTGVPLQRDMYPGVRVNFRLPRRTHDEHRRMKWDSLFNTIDTSMKDMANFDLYTALEEYNKIIKITPASLAFHPPEIAQRHKDVKLGLEQFIGEVSQKLLDLKDNRTGEVDELQNLHYRENDTDAAFFIRVHWKDPGYKQQTFEEVPLASVQAGRLLKEYLSRLRICRSADHWSHKLKSDTPLEVEYPVNNFHINSSNTAVSGERVPQHCLETVVGDDTMEQLMEEAGSTGHFSD